MQSVISRLEEGGGRGNRVDTLARVARALGRHLVICFPEKAPTNLNDGVQVALSRVILSGRPVSG